MGNDTALFLEVIEWVDGGSNEMLHRVPERGSGEIKLGAQLVVRESQVAVFFYGGKAIHVFGPGRHTLKTGNIPLLTKLLSVPWGMTSPLRAEVYFLSTRTFVDQRWGTRDPVAFRDAQLGLVRLRAHGLYTVRVIHPLLFINVLSGTVSDFATDSIGRFLSDVVVSRFNDEMGEHLDTLVNLPGRYDELAGALREKLQEDFGRFGLGLPSLYITSITPPLDVQKAIDDRSKLGLFQSLDELLKLKAASALEKGADNPSGAGQGASLGLGLMVPSLLEVPSGKPVAKGALPQCASCRQPLSPDARFCAQCGEAVTVFVRCEQCGASLAPLARFCSQCGRATEGRAGPRACAKCGYPNLAESLYCNQCGERLK